MRAALYLYHSHANEWEFAVVFFRVRVCTWVLGLRLAVRVRSKIECDMLPESVKVRYVSNGSLVCMGSDMDVTGNAV